MNEPRQRDRLIVLAQAQERLRQAGDLARSAAGMLAEEGVDGDGTIEPGVDFKAEIRLASAAGKSCHEAVDLLDAQIRKEPVP
ncbi:MAG TPA: hypothetical protein VLE97_06470 [Gaiellaceae bacterium]|nr:hypothetical protein [Gaiellaceae bacterium]